MIRFVRSAGVLATLVLLSGSVRASTLAGLQAYGTMESIGVRVEVQGDTNGNAIAYAQIRRKGDPTFLRGHRLLPVGFETTGTFPAGLQVGSLFFLSPDTDYEVQVVLEDPDDPAPSTVSSSVRTRANAPPAPAGKTLHVATSGNDANDGSLVAPVKTIAKGVALAAAGDRVLVAPGVYRDPIVLTASGTEAAPIWVSADGTGAIVDGSDPALDGASWTDESGGVWSTPYTFSGTRQYAAVDAKRIYNYDSLAALQAGTAGIPDAFYVGGGRLYIKLADATSPAVHEVRFAREQRILLDGAQHLVLDGFEVRYFYDAAVDLRGSPHCWIQNLYIHHTNNGIRIRLPGSIEDVVQNNRLYDTSVYGWPWNAVKAHDAEASGVAISGGRGHVVRGNDIDGFFNGIGASGWPDFNPDIASEIDIQANVIRNIGDDGYEPDGPAVNQRFVGNVIQTVYNAISLAPLNPGPVWLLRNVIDGYTHHVIKLNYLADPPVELRGWALAYHNTALAGAGVDADTAEYLAPQAQFGRLVTKNNIFVANSYAVVYESGPDLLAPIDWDFDNLYSTHKTSPKLIKWSPTVRYDTLADFAAATGYETHGFEVAPIFESQATGNYDLVAGSPLLDVGVVIPGINDQWMGAAPDIGAKERGMGQGGAGPSTGGSGGASAGSGGAGFSGGAGAGPSDGGSAKGGSGNGQPDSGLAGAAGTTPPSANQNNNEAGGCGCRLPGPTSSSAHLFALALLLGLARRRTQRRSCAQS